MVPSTRQRKSIFVAGDISAGIDRTRQNRGSIMDSRMLPGGSAGEIVIRRYIFRNYLGVSFVADIASAHQGI